MRTPLAFRQFHEGVVPCGGQMKSRAEMTEAERREADDALAAAQALNASLPQEPGEPSQDD